MKEKSATKDQESFSKRLLLPAIAFVVQFESMRARVSYRSLPRRHFPRTRHNDIYVHGPNQRQNLLNAFPKSTPTQNSVQQTRSNTILLFFFSFVTVNTKKVQYLLHINTGRINNTKQRVFLNWL